MRKLLSIVLTSIILFAPLQVIIADPLIDPNDSLEVVTPIANTKIGGNIKIEWRSFDDDQTAIPYYIELKDGATCKSNSFGRIGNNASSNSSKDSTNSIEWNTRETNTNKNIADGNYCLQICSAFKNGDQFYSVCNGRRITIVNQNSLPTINSTPSSLIINNTENWNYPLRASDTDGDQLRYYLLFAPDFLEINNSSGLIQTKEGVNRISNDINIAEYRVVVGVDDGVSGTTTQEFRIRVERNKTSNPIAQPTNPEPPQNIATQINIISPKDGTLFKGAINNVEWTALDPDGIEQVVLSYSSDLENWIEIVKSSETIFSRYSWNVSEITDGKYYLQVKITDKKGESVARVSKEFTIQNQEIDPDALKPLIVNVKPENGNTLSQSPTNIVGEFAAAEGETIDTNSLRVSLDDQNISSSCARTTEGFDCTLEQQLEPKEYTLSIEVEDLSGNSGRSESKFGISAPQVEVPQNNTGNNNTLVIIIIAVGLLIFVLIVLPWLLIGLSKRRSNKPKIKETKVVNIDNPAPSNQVNPTVQQPQSEIGNDFFNSYSFNTSTTPVNQPAPVAPSQVMNNTFKDISKKVSTFTPKVEEKSEIKPVLLSDNPNLGQNIQMAYSAQTTAQQDTFIEPKPIDQPTELPSPVATTDEELKRMYPELYGTGLLNVTKKQEDTKDNSTNSTQDPYFEPKPKD